MIPEHPVLDGHDEASRAKHGSWICYVVTDSKVLAVLGGSPR